MGQPVRTAGCLQAVAWLLRSSCTEHVHIPCYFPPFHMRLHDRGAKWTERQEFCVCGTWPLSVILFSLVNYIEEGLSGFLSEFCAT